MTEFKHPADAMRARIVNQLNCSHCEHVLYNKEKERKRQHYSWCRKRDKDPKPGYGFGFCEEFNHEPDSLSQKIDDAI